jgi:hypothetical protein
MFSLSPRQPVAILQAVQKWAVNGTMEFVNTICFQVGGQPDPVAAKFMQQVATVSGGVYRSIL